MRGEELLTQHVRMDTEGCELSQGISGGVQSIWESSTPDQTDPNQGSV